jgi:hypothetical protein
MKIEFEGYRNSFGKTRWFSIYPQKEKFFLSFLNSDNIFELKVIEAYSSMPEKPFDYPITFQSQ